MGWYIGPDGQIVSWKRITDDMENVWKEGYLEKVRETCVQAKEKYCKKIS